MTVQSSKSAPAGLVYVEKKSSPGLLAGIFGNVFAVLGILFLGIVFVPLAGICSAIGMVQGVSGRSTAGMAVSGLGVVLSLVGFFTSPMLLLALGIAGSH